MKLPKLKLRTFTEKNIMDMINYYSGRSFIEIRNRSMIAYHEICYHAHPQNECSFLM